jgi:diadenosine tetraphosphate (Ap4A) HIT family hydrolase
MNERYKDFVDVSKARGMDHEQLMQRIIDDGVCPFCPENLAKYHALDPIDETDEWILTPNMHPYEQTDRHWLLISRRHIEHVRELNDNEWRGLGRLVVKHTVDMPYGALAARFGDTDHTAASVAHLHFHLMQPIADVDPENKVRFKISN